MKKIEKQLEEMGNNMKIPESLEPKNMEKMLENRPQKKRKINVYLASGLVASVLLFVVCLPYTMKGITSGTKENNVNTVVETTNIPSESDERIYKELFQLFYNKGMGDKIDDLSYNGIDEKMKYSYTDEAYLDSRSSSKSSSKVAMQEDAGSSASVGGYSKVNSQVEGVAEGDIVVTDGAHIYIVRANLQRIQILHAKGEKVTEVSAVYYKDSLINEVSEMYVQNQHLILIGEAKEEEQETCILIYDISNPNTPKKLVEHVQSGSYETSRVNGDYLYTFSNFIAYAKKEENIKSYVPVLDEKVIEGQDIFIPKLKEGSSYYVISALKISDPEHFKTKKAFVTAGSPIFYVSESHIYLAMSTDWYMGYKESDFDKTHIIKYSYHNGEMKQVAENTIKGKLNNQFSLDEYKENLRAVVTYEKRGHEFNGVYVLDKELKELGSIGELAKDEEIYSARFMGDTGYFVTYRETDPLFGIDFSNPKKPKIIGKLKIPGFSKYLHFYGKNRLVGIGEEGNNVKLSMFDISDPKHVKEVSKEIINNSFYSEANENHKSVLIDVEKNIIGFPVVMEEKNDMEEQCYYVYSYDDRFQNKLKVAFKREKSMWNYLYEESLRGLYIGKYLYIVNTDTGVKTFDLSKFREKTEFRFREFK